MQLLKQFLQFIADNRLFGRKDRLLVAVSGGLDSVSLAHLCREAGYDFGIAHVNFNLRGEESRGDEEFVKNLAAQLSVPVHTSNPDVEDYCTANGVSIQVAARELRYTYFKKLQEEEDYSYVLTAHHADDNAETILMNFLKGTGIEGLRGILPLQQKICRPLLFASREQLAEYAESKKLEFREDSSNTTDKYTRNIIRNEVFPVLKKAYPAFRNNLVDNVERFREISLIYHDYVQKKLKKIIVRDRHEIKIPVQALLASGMASTLLYEALLPFEFNASQSHEAIKLLHTDSGKYIESEKFRLLRNRKWLVVSPKDATLQNIVVVEKGLNEVAFPGGKLIVKNMDDREVNDSSCVADIDSSKLEFPLLLRRWKTGDYFYPLGMKHKKKLSRFFVDHKLSLFEKERVWVLESGKKIVWVLGMRIDDRFKVNPQTKNKTRLTLISE